MCLQHPRVFAGGAERFELSFLGSSGCGGLWLRVVVSGCGQGSLAAGRGLWLRVVVSGCGQGSLSRGAPPERQTSGLLFDWMRKKQTVKQRKPEETAIVQEFLCQQQVYREQSDCVADTQKRDMTPTGPEAYPEPECIIGSTDQHGELMKNSSDVALLPAREASTKCPQAVVDFYERKLTWPCGDEEQ
ncbi:LOW QUALITY PROTEIN: hypothetical protein CRUP_004414 [Coryphaenoides rupestris]|nr:LOW QUALITY PROTEIN: hypothetical protein CRUP_004414 [Coryphaenoides rupestris]